MFDGRFANARAMAAGLLLAFATAACGAAYEVTGPQGNLVETNAGADNSVQQERPVIRMYDFSASPGGMTIPAGTAVEWKNVSAQTHSVSNYSTHPQAATWEDALLQPGGEFSHLFSVPGEYGFVCIFHQEVGYITVVPAETDDMDMDDDMDDMTDMDMDGMDMDMIP